MVSDIKEMWSSFLIQCADCSVNTAVVETHVVQVKRDNSSTSVVGSEMFEERSEAAGYYAKLARSASISASERITRGTSPTTLT